jgi:hypothetical protein
MNTLNTRYEVCFQDGSNHQGAALATTDLNEAIKFFLAVPQEEINAFAAEYKGIDRKRPNFSLELCQYVTDEDGDEEITEFTIAELPEELKAFIGVAADWNLEGPHKTCWIERYPKSMTPKQRAAIDNA